MIQKAAKKTADGNQTQHQAPDATPAEQDRLSEEKSELLSRLLGRLIARRWISEQQVRKANHNST